LLDGTLIIFKMSENGIFSSNSRIVCGIVCMLSSLEGKKDTTRETKDMHVEKTHW